MLREVAEGARERPLLSYVPETKIGAPTTEGLKVVVLLLRQLVDGDAVARPKHTNTHLSIFHSLSLSALGCC